MPSVVENLALILGGAVAGTALTSAFVAQELNPTLTCVLPVTIRPF